MGTGGAPGARPNRSGGRKVRMVNVDVDELDLEAVREEAALRLENLTEAPSADEDWNKIALNFYRAVEQSASRQYFDPIDWMMVYIMAENLSRMLEPQYVGMRNTGSGQEQEAAYESVPMPGSAVTAFRSLANDLLLTVKARQAAGLEIDRKAAPPDESEGAAAGNVVALRSQITG